MTSFENERDDVAVHETYAEEALELSPATSATSQDDEAGHSRHAGKAKKSMPVSSPHADGGHHLGATEAKKTLSPSAPIRPAPADKAALCGVIDRIAELQVRRKFWIAAINRQTNAAKALARRALGWRYDEEEDDRTRVNARAARIVAAALSGKPQRPEDEPVFAVIAADMGALSTSITPCHVMRLAVERDMRRAVRDLPVYAWAKAVHGLGELGLAVIVAEAGDLSGYPTKGHLWKRLGLAPRDGLAMSSWRAKGGLTADDWTEAGYSPRRRAEMHAVIAEPLFRQQSVCAGPYRAAYDRRRALTAATHPDWTKAHSHMDALRIMTKRLLRDLRGAWSPQDKTLSAPQ